MKNSLLKGLFKSLLIFLISFSAFESYAQKFDGIRYQAIIRDANGKVISTRSIRFKFTIYQTGNTADQYQEEQTVSTNVLGLVNLTVGQGVPVAPSNRFDLFDWAKAGSGKFMFKIEVDENGGRNYRTLGESILYSVPFAMHAKTVENDQVDDADADPTNELQDLSINYVNNQLSITGSSQIIDLGVYRRDAQKILYDPGSNKLVLWDGTGPNDSVSMAPFALDADLTALTNQYNNDQIALAARLKNLSDSAATNYSRTTRDSIRIDGMGSRITADSNRLNLVQNNISGFDSRISADSARLAQHRTNDLDTSMTNETISSVNLSGTTLQITEAGVLQQVNLSVLDQSGNVVDLNSRLVADSNRLESIKSIVYRDSSATNEIQTISLNAAKDSILLSKNGGGIKVSDLKGVTPGIDSVLAAGNNAGGDSIVNLSYLSLDAKGTGTNSKGLFVVDLSAGSNNLGIEVSAENGTSFNEGIRTTATGSGNSSAYGINGVAVGTTNGPKRGVYGLLLGVGKAGDAGVYGRSNASGRSTGIHGAAFGAAADTNIALYADARNAVVNMAAWFDNGNVYVDDTLYLRSGAANNYVLTSDANGRAEWKAAQNADASDTNELITSFTLNGDWLKITEGTGSKSISDSVSFMGYVDTTDFNTLKAMVKADSVRFDSLIADVYAKRNIDTARIGGLEQLVNDTSDYFQTRLASLADSAATNFQLIGDTAAFLNDSIDAVAQNLAALNSAYSSDTARISVLENGAYKDSSATNEIQVLSISNDTIYLTNGGFVELPANAINNDNDSTNELNTAVTFSGDSVHITDAAGTKSIDLASLNQSGALSTLGAKVAADSLALGTASQTNASNLSTLTADVNAGAYKDSSATNEIQVLSISNDTIYLSNGGFVQLPSAASNNDNDSTNELIANALLNAGDSLMVVEGGDTNYVDLSSLNQSGDITTLSALMNSGDSTNNSLRVSDSTMFSLAIDTLNNSLYNDLDSTNEIQVLSISNDTIYLSDGGFAVLPAGQATPGLDSVLSAGNDANNDTIFNLSGLAMGTGSREGRMINVVDSTQTTSGYYNTIKISSEGTATANQSQSGLYSEIKGTNGNNIAVDGTASGNSSGNNSGVEGYAYNSSETNKGVYGYARTGKTTKGVHGDAGGGTTENMGVHGQVLDTNSSAGNIGVFGIVDGKGQWNEGLSGFSIGTNTTSNTGVYAQARNSSDNRGVVADAIYGTDNIGVIGNASGVSGSNLVYGVYGQADSLGTYKRGVVGVLVGAANENSAAVYGIANGVGRNVALYGRANNANNTSDTNIAVFADAENAAVNVAGWFKNGNVFVDDTLFLSNGAQANYVLTSDANGKATWQTPASSADNLGNHIMTTNLQTNGKYISGDGGNEGIFIDSDGKVAFGTNTIPAVSQVRVKGEIWVDSLRIRNTASTTYNQYGMYNWMSGTGSGRKTAVVGTTSGGSGEGRGVVGVAQDGTTNMGIYGYASGGNTNWAGYFDAGNVYIKNELHLPTGAGVGKVLTSDASGKATWETVVDTLTCPAGFSKVNEKFCISTAERTATTWFNAAADCAGDDAELASYVEWYTAADILTLTDETDDAEWVSNISQNNMMVVGNGAITTRAFQDPTLTAPYRCVVKK